MAAKAPPESGDSVTAAFYAALADDDPEELYDNAPCAYVSALPDGTIIKVNATFLAWSGYDRDAVLGRRFQDLLARGELAAFEAHERFYEIGSAEGVRELANILRTP